VQNIAPLGVGKVNKNLLAYLNGEKNSVVDQFVISREKAHNSECIQVQYTEIPKPLYTFWVSPRKSKNKTPKHTGGKKPYVMLMLQELEILAKKGIPAETVGHLIFLVPYIEWKTGKLVIGREKRNVKVEDIQKIFNKSKRATLYIIADLKKHSLIERKEGAYFVSRAIIKKG